jgi:hypothetical protein
MFEVEKHHKVFDDGKNCVLYYGFTKNLSLECSFLKQFLHVFLIKFYKILFVFVF